jgi:metallophosphoesterase (TIGR00282 family)
MKILYIGDVMADPGIETVERVLPNLKQDLKPDLVIAQAENVTDGRGIITLDFNRLKKTGIDFFTGGNHIFDQKDIYGKLFDPNQPIIRPANYPEKTPGLGWKYINTPKGKVLVISLLGQIVGKNSGMVLDNPLKVVDEILKSEEDIQKVATVVNFHGDFSSEKLIIGHYLDGRVSAVLGDHWHIPTADSRILPKGTAHITDVGMCGTINSSLGVISDVIIKRWRDGDTAKNAIELNGPFQFNAVLFDVDEKTGLSKSIELVQKQLD